MNPYQTGGGQGGRPQLRIGGPVPPVLKSFLIACGMGFLLQLLWPQLTVYLGLTPAAFWRGAVFQLVTFHFLHGNMWHIILNLFVLWMFAGNSKFSGAAKSSSFTWWSSAWARACARCCSRRI